MSDENITENSDQNTGENPESATEAAIDETVQESASVESDLDATEVVGEDGDPEVTSESFADAFTAATDGPESVDNTAPPQYGVGPFSVREVSLGAVWLVAFIVSFFPMYGGLGTGVSVWTSGIDWVLAIGAPTVAVFLLGLRRLSPQGIRRVGSLGIDQFASVVFSVSALIWLGTLSNSFSVLTASGFFYATWVVWVEFVLMLAGVMLTVFAPLLPTIGDDFRHRPEVPAHRYASPARPVVARPAQPKVAGAAASTEPYGATPYGSAAVGSPTVDAAPEAQPQSETVTSTEAVAEAAPASEAFWALAPAERNVVDENGTPIFTVGPTAWALVIEDRGTSFVVRHEDGRIGYLNDVSGVTRG
ncbi:MAG: hypothetical protein QM622_01665 [Microbacterium sp.]